MDLAKKIAHLKEQIRQIKASQAIGMSNAVAYNYKLSHTFTYDSGSSSTYFPTIIFVPQNDKWVLAHFTALIYINNNANNNFALWYFNGPYTNIRGDRVYGNNCVAARILSDQAVSNGAHVFIEIFAKSSAPGKLIIEKD